MAVVKPKEEMKDIIPDIICDPGTKKAYNRGRFLGKGGFAKCYELTDVNTKQVFAGKIVSKTLLVKQHQKDKMAQEIAIHRELKHHNVVKFISFFEDSKNVYIILEICKRRSLMEMHKRRKALTEPETRYFLKQIVMGCKYLHDTRVIHRDLKLGNLFLNDEMELKIGDFGLATKLTYEGERKKTLCGTPNYIAPEVLGKKGHSYEVDVWSLGCIMYTLLVGRPPFETSNLKDTYTRIKKNEFNIPARISLAAASLIRKMLDPDPIKRPSMDTILMDEFMVDGYCPSRLPTACLTTAPRFDQRAEFSMIAPPRRPLLEVKLPDANEMKMVTQVEKMIKPKDEADQDNLNRVEEHPGDCYLSELFTQLSKVAGCKLPVIMQEDEAEDPSLAPMVWVSKWVDYSDKYGLGYQLCDNSVGVLFNDSTRLLLLQDNETIHYIERDGREHYHALTAFPESLGKKVTLIKYFRTYMNDHLLKAGASMVPRDGDELARLPYMRSWFRTRSAIVMHLTNGTMQINFFQDHTKLILCPLLNGVTYIDEHRVFRTFKLSSIEKFGCTKDLFGRLRYARTMVERLLASNRSRSKNAVAAT